MRRMRSWKKFLAVLLAAALLGGSMAAVASAALTVEGETPAYAKPYVGTQAGDFAKQTLKRSPTPQSGAPKVPTARAYDMMMALLPLFVNKSHEKIWGPLPAAAQQQFEKDVAALFEKNGWSGDITLDELFNAGQLPAYARGVNAAYARAVAENESPFAALTLVAWQLLFIQLLPQDITLYIVLP